RCSASAAARGLIIATSFIHRSAPWGRSSAGRWSEACPNARPPAHSIGCAIGCGEDPSIEGFCTPSRVLREPLYPDPRTLHPDSRTLYPDFGVYHRLKEGLKDCDTGFRWRNGVR